MSVCDTIVHISLRPRLRQLQLPSAFSIADLRGVFSIIQSNIADGYGRLTLGRSEDAKSLVFVREQFAGLFLPWKVATICHVFLPATHTHKQRLPAAIIYSLA
jgi:hypothetical protein